jgi:hypothetical protein
MHLEANGSCASLALTGAGRILAEIGQVTATHAFGWELALDFLAATVIDKDLEMHFGFAAELVNVAEELALVGADGFAKAFVVAKDGSKPKGKDRGMLEAVGDDPGMIDAGFLVEGFRRIVFADDNSEVTSGVKEDLVATYSEGRFHRNRFAMTGQLRKSLFFTDAVGIPCHDETLRLRALVSVARW